MSDSAVIVYFRNTLSAAEQLIQHPVVSDVDTAAKPGQTLWFNTDNASSSQGLVIGSGSFQASPT